MKQPELSRRKFLDKTKVCGLGAAGLMFAPQRQPSKLSVAQSENQNVFGPRTGYTPHISNLVSMMNWMRSTILRPVQGMSIKDLDYLHDENSNSIGAMLLHLAATEKYYYLNTFENKRWGSWDAKVASEWDTPMNLGERGRQMIKGNPLDFYLEKLNSIRENTLAGLKEKDDDWLFYTDENFVWGPTNNYCKWFHVVEHESNHNGQMKYVSSRIA